ncbi:MAG: ABC transporter ATP-binding protein, partial [Planctomycetota bacterium]
MSSWWWRLADYARPHKRDLALLVCLTLFIVVLEALKPWPLKLIVDSVLADQPLPGAVSWITALPGGASPVALLGWLTTATILIFLGAWASRMARSYVQSGVGNQMSYELGADVFERLQRLSLRFHGKKPTGDLLRRVTKDTRCVRELMMSVFLPGLTSLGSLAAMFAIMWQLDRSLTLLALVAVPLLGVPIRVFVGQMEERSYRQSQLEGELTALAEQTLTALPIVQAFSRESYEDQRFVRLCRRTGQAHLSVVASQLQFRAATDSVTALGTVAVMVLGALHVLQGSLSVGALLVFLAYVARLYEPLETLAYLSWGFADASAGARRVFEILDVEEQVHDLPGAKPLPRRPAGQRGHVQMENVTFGYEPGRPVLQGVSLEARPGETVALVGPTGVGKTTLVSLIPRFFDPWEGRVLVDGSDLRRVQLSSLRAQVTLCLQEPFLFPLTVRDNIAYARPEAHLSEILAAARA